MTKKYPRVVIRDSIKDKEDIENNKKELFKKQKEKSSKLKEKKSSENGNKKYFSNIEDKSLLENITLIKEAINNNIPLLPEIIYNNMLEDPKKYNKAFIKLIIGVSQEFLMRNIVFKDFREELKRKIIKKIEELKKEGLIEERNIKNSKIKDSQGSKGIDFYKEYKPTERALTLLASKLLEEEFKKIRSKEIFIKGKDKKGYGEEKEEVIKGRKIDTKKTLKKVAKRMHKNIELSDISFQERKYKESSDILILLDKSYSMRKKIEDAKKACLSLGEIAINHGNKVGFISFSDKIEKEILPTNNKKELFLSITEVKPGGRTNIGIGIRKAIEIGKRNLHLVIITDALHNTGDIKELKKIVGEAKNNRISISIIGIKIDKEGLKTAEEILSISEGRLYNISTSSELDLILLKDYLNKKI